MTESDWLLVGFIAACVTALWAVGAWSRVGAEQIESKAPPNDEQGMDR